MQTADELIRTLGVRIRMTDPDHFVISIGESADIVRNGPLAMRYSAYFFKKVVLMGNMFQS